MLTRTSNAAWETFLSLFDPICNRHAPFKNTKIPCNPPPWLDSDYIELRNKVFKAKYKAEKSKNSHDWEIFKTLRNSLDNFACKLKKEYFENKLNEAGKDSKKLWKTLRSVLPNKTDQSGADSMVNDNNVVTDPKDIANIFNSYFANIGESLASAFDGSDECEVDSTK